MGLSCLDATPILPSLRSLPSSLSKDILDRFFPCSSLDPDNVLSQHSGAYISGWWSLFSLPSCNAILSKWQSPILNSYFPQHDYLKELKFEPRKLADTQAHAVSTA